MASTDETTGLLVKLWNNENKLLVYRTLALLVIDCLLVLSFTLARPISSHSVLTYFILLVGIGLNAIWIYLGASSWSVLRSLYQRLAKEELFATLWDGGKVVYCYLVPIAATAVWLAVLVLLLARIGIQS